MLIGGLALLGATPARASQALVVAVYQDCRIVDTEVLIDAPAMPAARSAEIKARVATVSREPQLAVPRIVQVLRHYGIDSVETSQQGLGACTPQTSGKFVEAVGKYCGAELRHAEVFVDQHSFIRRERPGVSFSEFLSEALLKLRQAEIFDRPVVSIGNAPQC